MQSYSSRILTGILISVIMIGSMFLSSCSSRHFETDDTIEFIKIDPGEKTVLPVSDLFYAASYHLSFKDNDQVKVLYEPGSQMLSLDPHPGFSGLTLIQFTNGNVPMVLPVIVSTKTEVSFQIDVGTPHADVFLMGNFNNWSRNSIPMTDEDGDGIYTTTVYLADGIYEYQFVLPDREIYDPENPEKVDNGFGYFNSLLHVRSEDKDAIPNLYFLPDQGDGKIRLAVDSQNELDAQNLTLLADNQILGENHFSFNKNRLTIDPVHCPHASVLRAVATYDHKPGNILTVWLKDGRPISNREDFIWQDALIYSLMIDRFENGDPKNDQPIEHPDLNWKANFQGGDFAGIIQTIKSGYFNEIGVNTIWISPVNKTTDKAWQEWPEPHRYYTGYHGYWPTSPDQTEPRFGSMDQLKQLVQTAHEHDIKILLDFISNHVHVEHPYYQNNRDWFGSYELPDGTQNIRRFDEYRLTTWFDTFLPSFDYELSLAAVDAMTDNAVWWLKETGVDGFRHDATKHVPYIFWRILTRKINAEIRPERMFSIYQIGETFGGDDLIKSYVNNGMLSSQFNSNQYFVLRRLFTDPNSSLTELEAAIEKSNQVYGDNNLMGNIIGSHDQNRIMGLLEGDISLSENGVERAFQEPAITVDKPSTYLKERVLFCYLLTIPGVPIVYYGDEFGMTGANDPDNRRMMRFGDELSAPEKEQLQAFRELTKIRQDFSCLRRGDYLNLYTDKSVMVYSRGDISNRLVIIFNKSNIAKKLNIDLPDWIRGQQLKSVIGDDSYTISDGNIQATISGLSYDIFKIR